MRNRLAAIAAMAVVMCAGGVLSGCDQGKAVYPGDRDNGATTPAMSNQKRETIFGAEGILGGKSKDNQGGGAGIGVNSFLWRASLDTLAFMPIASADPFGGTILTDWYQLPETQNERFKLNVFIVDRALRADGIKVSVFKQVRGAANQWADAKVDPKMAAEIEDSILTRARQLRIVSQ